MAVRLMLPSERLSIELHHREALVTTSTDASAGPFPLAGKIAGDIVIRKEAGLFGEFHICLTSEVLLAPIPGPDSLGS